MVTWGAERILSAEEGEEIQDEDIDALLARFGSMLDALFCVSAISGMLMCCGVVTCHDDRGEEQAEELNKRLKDNCQQNLLSFSLFQDKSLYSFEGMDYSGTPTEFLKVNRILFVFVLISYCWGWILSPSWWLFLLMDILLCVSLHCRSRVWSPVSLKQTSVQPFPPMLSSTFNSPCTPVEVESEMLLDPPLMGFFG